MMSNDASESYMCSIRLYFQFYLKSSLSLSLGDTWAYE
jgi:hypothetical protein